MRRATKLYFKRNVRRLVLAILIPVLLLFALRLIWGYQADRQFAATRAALIARGILFQPDRSAVPDDDNAALGVMNGLRYIQLTPGEKELVEGGSLSYFNLVDRIRTDEEKRELRGILAKNASVIAFLRVAVARKHVQWPNADDAISHRDFVNMFNLLCNAALLAHDARDDAAALDDLRLILALADVADQAPDMLAHITAAEGRHMAALAVERLVPEFDLVSQPAAMEAAVRLLRELQPSQHYLDAPARNWGAQIDVLANRERWSEEAALHGWWLQPRITNEMTRIMNKMAAAVIALRADNYQSYSALIPPKSPDYPSPLHKSVFSISDHFDARVWHLMAWHHFGSLSDSAAASLLLASRIFEARHSYAPRESRELVPEILSAVPVDPYSGDHRPMRFRLDPDGPTVWSVGENGTDEGGAMTTEPLNFRRKRRYYSTTDIVYGAAWRKATAPAATHAH